MAIDLRLLFSDEAEDGDERQRSRRPRGASRFYGPPCIKPGCTGRTVGNKPYCLDCIHLMPYAALIQKREAQRVAEIQTKNPPIDGTVAQDLLGAIRLGQSSVAALARDIRVSISIIKNLAGRMAVAGIVELRGTNRGLYVAIVPKKGEIEEWT